MLTIPLLALRNLQHPSASGGLIRGASSSPRRSRTHLPPHQDGPFLPASSSSASPSSSSLLTPTWSRPRHASIYGTTRSSADEVLLGQSGRADEERYASSESRVISEGVGEVREMRVENLEHEEVEGSAEALFLRRASEVESGKVGMSAPRGGRKRKILQKKVRRDSKKVGESTSLFRDTEIGSVHSNEEKKKKKKKREEGSPRPVDLGREVTGDHEDGVLNSEGKRRFSQRLTSVGSAFNRVSNKVLRKMTGFGTSRKGSPGSNSSEEAGEEDEEGEALIAQDQRCSTDNDSQHHATSSPVASERELRGSGSSRQTLYSPCSSPAETMPLTPSYTRDDGGPLEPCPTKMPPSQPLRDHLDDDEAFFPHYDQALPSSSPHPHRSHYAPSPSPSPLTSTTKPTPSTPNQHPETPPHLRPRLSGNQTPLTNTQYAQMIQLSLFHAQRTGAYCEEEISPAYRLAPANVTKAGDQRKSAEIWRLRVEAEGRADGGGGIVGLSEEEGKAGGGKLAAAVSRRRISLRRLLPGRK